MIDKKVNNIMFLKFILICRLVNIIQKLQDVTSLQGNQIQYLWNHVNSTNQPLFYYAASLTKTKT